MHSYAPPLSEHSEYRRASGKLLEDRLYHYIQTRGAFLNKISNNVKKNYAK